MSLIKTHRALLFALSLLVGFSAGCGNMFNQWPGEVNSTPPPKPNLSSQSDTKREPKPHHPSAFASRSVATRVERNGAEPQKAETTVSLGSEDASKGRAERLLNDTKAKLAKIDGAKLSGQNATAYEQADGFVKAATKALNERDYLAASGFAEKASLLTDKLAPASARIQPPPAPPPEASK